MCSGECYIWELFVSQVKDTNKQKKNLSLFFLKKRKKKKPKQSQPFCMTKSTKVRIDGTIDYNRSVTTSGDSQA